MTTAVLPESSEVLTEWIDGVEVELPPMSMLAIYVASILTELLSGYVRRQRLGFVMCEGIFRIPSADNPLAARRPDLAFISHERWPRGQRLPHGGHAAPVVPDLVVEVISPTDNHSEVDEKVLDYFAAGVRRVWVINPVLRRAVDYASPAEMRGLIDSDALEGGDVVPGFRIVLSELLDPPG